MTLIHSINRAWEIFKDPYFKRNEKVTALDHKIAETSIKIFEYIALASALGCLYCIYIGHPLGFVFALSFIVSMVAIDRFHIYTQWQVKDGGASPLAKKPPIDQPVIDSDPAFKQIQKDLANLYEPSLLRLLLAYLEKRGSDTISIASGEKLTLVSRYETSLVISAELEHQAGVRLTLDIESEGRITGVYENEQRINPDRIQEILLNENAIWKKRLSELLHTFLSTKIIRLYRGQMQIHYATHDIIAVHPLVLKYRPESVLSELCKTGEFVMRKVVFLTDTLENGEGIDAGGLSSQLRYDLSRHLLDGYSDKVFSRTIKVTNGLPTLSSLKPTQDEITTLKNFGKFLGACYYDDSLITGRVLPDNYFSLLKELYPFIHIKELYPFIHNGSLNDMLIVRVAEKIGVKEDAWMWKYLSSTRELHVNERAHLNTLWVAEDVTKIKQIKTAIENYLLQNYGLRVRAAHYVMQGLYFQLPDDRKLTFQFNSTDEISTKIQGPAFNREDIASRIKMDNDVHYSNSISKDIVRQKTQWLKEFIIEKPEEWVKKFLVFIAGIDTLLAKSIQTKGTSGIFCVACTCYNKLDVPTSHISRGTPPGVKATDKEKFFNNLSESMVQTGFDTK